MKPSVTKDAKPNARAATEESTESDESSDEEPSKRQSVQKTKQDEMKASSSSDEQSEEDESSEEDERPSGNLKKSVHKLALPFTSENFCQLQGTDVKMVDTPSATKMVTQVIGSKTLFMGNLSYSINKEDVKNFFKDAGEIIDVRLAIKDDLFAGYGHIEFATVEAAQEARKLNNEMLKDRPVRLDFAKERSAVWAFTPRSCKENSYQKGKQAEGMTVFVRGFDTSSFFENIKSTLKRHFGNCGEISRISIPKDYESGVPKGIAYIDFADSNGFIKALALDGSEVGGFKITVQKARPKGDNLGSGSGEVRGVQRCDGRDNGRGPTGRNGRDGGRGTRSRGPSKPSMTTLATGKKTVFSDD